MLIFNQAFLDKEARAFSTPTSVSPWAAAFWAAADCSTACEVAMRTLRAVALSCLACGSRASQSHFSVATYEALTYKATDVLDIEEEQRNKLKFRKQ